MPKRVITENEIEVILDIVRHYPEGISQKDIAIGLTPRVPERTLQFRIKNLVDIGKLVKSGKSRRTTKYSLPAIPPAANTEDTATPAQAMENIAIPLSAESTEIRNYITLSRHRPFRTVPGIRGKVSPDKGACRRECDDVGGVDCWLTIQQSIGDPQ